MQSERNGDALFYMRLYLLSVHREYLTWCTRLRGTRYGLSFYILIGTIYVNYTYTVYNVLARDILRACRARVVLVASEMVPPKGL